MLQYIKTGHVLSDGQLAMNSCGWITPSEHLTLQQLKGLEGEYAKNCNCKVTHLDNIYLFI